MALKLCCGSGREFTGCQLELHGVVNKGCHLQAGDRSHVVQEPDVQYFRSVWQEENARAFIGDMNRLLSFAKSLPKQSEDALATRSSSSRHLTPYPTGLPY